MKKILILLSLSLLVFLPNLTAFAQEESTQNSGEDNKIDVAYFYSVTCPACEKNKPFMKEMEKKYKDRVRFYKFQVYKNEQNTEATLLFLRHIKLILMNLEFLYFS